MADPLSRRKFIEATALGAGIAALSAAPGESPAAKPLVPEGKFAAPVAISTWRHGVAASRAAVRVLLAGGSPLDAVEKGINLVEKDPEVESVGVGGLPNQDGEVELDAAIMNGDLRSGSVMALRGIATPISVARRVMERTRHIQLVGEGALRFALAEGFPTTVLPTPKAREKWEKWRASPDRPVPGAVPVDAPGPTPAGAGAGKKGRGAEKNRRHDREHDTVATLVLDARGGMAAGCSTSGLPWKLPGRVGDSPIVGAGLYCDGEVGAAGATGIGEEILRVCGSFLIVEGMRRGLSPRAAIEEALRRMLKADPQNRKRQMAFIALSRSGEIGAGAILPGFQVAVASGDGSELVLDVPALSS